MMMGWMRSEANEALVLHMSRKNLEVLSEGTCWARFWK